MRSGFISDTAERVDPAAGSGSKSDGVGIGTLVPVRNRTRKYMLDFTVIWTTTSTCRQSSSFTTLCTARKARKGTPEMKRKDEKKRENKR